MCLALRGVVGPRWVPHLLRGDGRHVRPTATLPRSATIPVEPVWPRAIACTFSAPELELPPHLVELRKRIEPPGFFVESRYAFVDVIRFRRCCRGHQPEQRGSEDEERDWDRDRRGAPDEGRGLGTLGHNGFTSKSSTESRHSHCAMARTPNGGSNHVQYEHRTAAKIGSAVIAPRTPPTAKPTVNSTITVAA